MKGGWEAVDPRMREVIDRVCTEAQREVLKLRAAGYGWRRIAIVLDVDEKTVRDRFKRAARRITQEVGAMRGFC